MKKVHYISGITIAVFLAMHLFNHLSSVAGIEVHIKVMSFLRLFYRNIFIEPVLISAVLVQIFTGIKLFIAKRKMVVTGFERLQMWSGLYLAIFFIIHLTAVFTGRYILHLDTNFYFAAVGLNTFPYNLFFIPYYSLAILAFFGHVAAIHSKKMKFSVLGLTPNKQSILILIVGVLMNVGIIYGMTNHFHGVAIPKKYEILVGKY